MTIKHQATREEETYGHLLDEIWEKLSEPVRTLIGKAHSAAYTANLVHNFSFQPEQDDEALEEMRLTDAGLTEREREPLAKLWRAALAAASIDPDDFETLAGYRVCRGNLHRYLSMPCGPRASAPTASSAQLSAVRSGGLLQAHAAGARWVRCPAPSSGRQDRGRGGGTS